MMKLKEFQDHIFIPDLNGIILPKASLNISETNANRFENEVTIDSKGSFRSSKSELSTVE